MPLKTIAVLTAGGDAPGMNAAIRAVVRSALSCGLNVTGVRRGYRGLYEKDFFSMNSRHVSGIINLGGTILKSVRFPEFQKREFRQQAAENVRQASIDALVVIGGDGTARGALAFHQDSQIPVAVVPASIDNDLGGTELTIGFDTAVNTAVEAVDRIRDTATSHDRTFIIEVMGRHCGNLALEVGLACGAEIIIIPEQPLNYEKLFQEITTADQQGKESVLIILAEGAAKAPEMAQIISRQFPRKEIRYAILGYIQRGGRPTYATRVLATKLGVAAIQTLMKGNTCHLIGWQNGQTVAVPLQAALASRVKLQTGNLDLTRLLSI